MRSMRGGRRGNLAVDKPYSQACDNNRDPILAVISRWFAETRAVLEIGSGTGQHAVYFGEHLPHLIWHTSDVAEHHAGIQAWIDDAGLQNVRAPLVLDVTQEQWPAFDADSVFCANSIHIMNWAAVESLVAGVGKLLTADGAMILYGPFNYGGNYTSDSNARFDQWLKARDPGSGIRDFEAVDFLAQAAGMVVEDDVAMPANNRTVCWVKG